MSTIEPRKPILIKDLIEAVRSGGSFDDDLCLYAKEDEEVINSELVCYLDEYPEVVNDTDQFSDFVMSNNLCLVYYGEQFEDVMRNVYEQKASATSDEVILALNYYLKNDDFLDIS